MIQPLIQSTVKAVSGRGHPTDRRGNGVCQLTKYIRVLIADDSHEMQQGLTTFIEFVEDFELVGVASTGREAISLCASARPDVVLMDLIMPEMDGLTAIHLLQKEHPDVRVIALTSYPQGFIASLIPEKVFEYLTKDVPADKLADTIRRAAAHSI